MEHFKFRNKKLTESPPPPKGCKWIVPRHCYLVRGIFDSDNVPRINPGSLQTDILDTLSSFFPRRKFSTNVETLRWNPMQVFMVVFRYGSRYSHEEISLSSTVPLLELDIPNRVNLRDCVSLLSSVMLPIVANIIATI